MFAPTFASAIAPHHSASPDLHAALEKLNDVLAPSFTPADIIAVQAARRSVATALNRLDKPPARGPLTEALLAAADLLALHPADAAAINELYRPAPVHSGWTGTLVQMFAAPAWQTTALRPLGDQPAWLLPSYARYVFAAPACFDTTQDEHRWTDHLIVQLGALVRLIETNRGSSSVNAIARIAVNAADNWPAVGPAPRLRLRQHQLGRLLTLLAPRLPAFVPPPSPPALGAILRVALVGDGSAPAGVYDAGHLKTLLDPERIEITAYSLNELPADTAARVEMLRAAQFDAVIFAGDLTRPSNPLTALALHRLAVCQFATSLCPHTTGLPEIDVFLGDSVSVPEAHTERIATLPAALAFDPPESAGPASLTRADFGLPADAHLLVATAHPAHSTAATRDQWTRLLEKTGHARLILLPGICGLAMELLFADCERRFGERVIIASHTPLDTAAVQALVRVCDGYLPGPTPADRLNTDFAQRLNLSVPDAPARIDCLSFADALTSVIESACRTPDASLLVTPAACDLATRHEQGNHLLAFGRTDRAVIYLLAAVDDPQAGPEVWHDLALALHANHQGAEAVQAMETCVRLAPDRLDSWLQLADWATDYGHTELVGEIHEVVRTLAPADPRVTSLAERLAS
jgi:hypothetical protein